MVNVPGEYSRNVFINCPFDAQYKPLFEAAVFAVQIAGFEPRCALEASNAGQARLDRIMDIISQCRYGMRLNPRQLTFGDLCAVIVTWLEEEV